MLKIDLPAVEFFDEETQEFKMMPSAVVELEHSLVSLSKWESKHEKPFLVKGEKEDSEIFDYLEAMVSSGEVPENFIQRLSKEQFNTISDYIDAKMTATWFSDTNKAGASRETITSELIYYWMISHNIPIECQYWHLNRLLTLIKVCNVKNQPAKKMSKSEIARRNRELNAQRRAQYGTSG